jgi:hypothetical protein
MISLKRVLLLTIAPPENVHGVRVVLYRHLVDNNPFEVKVVTLANTSTLAAIDQFLRFPPLVSKLRNSRFGPAIAKWVKDYECLVWCRTAHRQLETLASEFQPEAVLFLADNSLGEVALRLARKHRIPAIGLFLDWFPIMKGYFGHRWTVRHLDRRFRRHYCECDLAICTSDGMREALGHHQNSHVIYPIGGKHRIPPRRGDQSNTKFRLTYVGSVENFYGRMICSLINEIHTFPGIEIRIVGPNADWPKADLEKARKQGIYLGFKPPEEAAQDLADADALLVVMSFEKDHELFMRTSFTTKFLDYAAFHKPIILWGPDYCTPSRLAEREDGAIVVNDPKPNAVVDEIQKLQGDLKLTERYASASRRLHETVFNPDRLQNIFVGEITKLIEKYEQTMP